MQQGGGDKGVVLGGGGKSVRNWAVVSLLTAQLVFPGIFDSLQHWCPLNWPTSLTVPTRSPIHHFATSHVSSLPGHFWDQSWVLSSAGCAGLCWWLLGTVLWEFRARSHGLQEPPWLRDGSALRGEQGRILCERS